MNNIPLTIITLPIWWYTTGLSLFWDWFSRKYRYHLQSTGLVAFAHHWKEPLYGDYTRSGKIVSFFLRIIIVIYKAISFLFRILLLSLALVFYFTILPAVLTLIFYQIFGMYA